MSKVHLLEIRDNFEAECIPVTGGPVTVQQMEVGSRIEAQVRPFVADGVEQADLHLSHCVMRSIPFRLFLFIDREPGQRTS